MNPERVYTVLLEPHFSEKMAMKGEESNQYGFKVAKDATKAEIKEAVEKLFSVKVDSVRTFIISGGKKRALVRLAKEFKADDVAVKLKMIA